MNNEIAEFHHMGNPLNLPRKWEFEHRRHPMTNEPVFQAAARDVSESIKSVIILLIPHGTGQVSIKLSSPSGIHEIAISTQLFAKTEKNAPHPPSFLGVRWPHNGAGPTPYSIPDEAMEPLLDFVKRVSNSEFVLKGNHPRFTRDSFKRLASAFQLIHRQT